MPTSNLVLTPTVSLGRSHFSPLSAGHRAPERTGRIRSEQADAWRQVAAAYHAAGLSTIYLIRGSVGLAAANTLEALARTFPPAEGCCAAPIASWPSRRSDDGATFTPAYAREFERSLGAGGGPRIAVRLVEWSDENNHLGRADAAVRLVAPLAGRPGRTSPVACWSGRMGTPATSLALATHLLSGNRADVEAFFPAAEIYYRWPLLGWIDIPLWRRVRALLD